MVDRSETGPQEQQARNRILWLLVLAAALPLLPSGMFAGRAFAIVIWLLCVREAFYSPTLWMLTIIVAIENLAFSLGYAWLWIFAAMSGFGALAHRRRYRRPTAEDSGRHHNGHCRSIPAIRCPARAGMSQQVTLSPLRGGSSIRHIERMDDSGGYCEFHKG